MKTDDLMAHWLREVSGRPGAWTILGEMLVALSPDGSVSAADRQRAVESALSGRFRQHLPYLAWMANDQMNEARAALWAAGDDPRIPREKNQYLGWGRDDNKPDGQPPLAAALREGNLAAVAQALSWWPPYGLPTSTKGDRNGNWRVAEVASFLGHALEAGQWECATLIWDRVKGEIPQEELDRSLLHLAAGLFLASQRGCQASAHQAPLRGQDPATTAEWINRLLDAGANPNASFELAKSSATEFLAGPYTGDVSAIEAAGWEVVRDRSHYIYANCVSIKHETSRSWSALDLFCSSANHDCPPWWIKNIRVSPHSDSRPKEDVLIVLRDDLVRLRQAVERLWKCKPPQQKSARMSFVMAVCAHAFSTSSSNKELDLPSWVSEGWESFSTAELFSAGPNSPHAPIVDLFGAFLKISSGPNFDRSSADALLLGIMSGREEEVGPREIVALTVRGLAVGCDERFDAIPLLAKLLAHQDAGFQSRFSEWNDQRDAMKQERLLSDSIDGYSKKASVQSDIDNRLGIHDGMLLSLAAPLSPPRPRI